MLRLGPGLSITHAAVLVLLVCAARVAVCQGESETITIMLPSDVPLELVCILAGIVQMGSPDTERSRNPREGPI